MKQPPLFFLFLFGLALAMIGATHWLFILIRNDDENLYKKIGSPHLFANNTTTSVYIFWRWLFGSRLGDNLSKKTRFIAWAIRISTPLYLVGLIYAAIEGFGIG